MAPSSATNSVEPSSSAQLTTSSVRPQAVPAPSITYYTGSPWTDTQCSRYPSYGYLQVSYYGRTSGAARVVAHGSNLGSIRSVQTWAQGYGVSLVSVTPTSVTLDVRAVVGENPGPAANLPLGFTYGSGNTWYSPTVRLSVIPTLAVDNLTWGQCTWFAGGIARIMHNQAPVMAYSLGTNLSANPASAGFPRSGSVLMVRNPPSGHPRHMAYDESTQLNSQTANRDGSIIYTYTLSGRQYNIHCDGQSYPFTTTMQILRSKSGAYTLLRAPLLVAGYTVDAVAQ